MMAELEIDQSNLPRVQEVCQSFAVLEDGVLAHNLQEQEIEQYYTTNMQKNQLVQNDIRVAKMLQDEEEEDQAIQSTLSRHASRQLEEEDFEYARLIQEEIQRCSEQARRREQEDEEIAKRLQEEEKQRITRRSRGQGSEGSTSDPALPSPHQHTLSSPHQGEEQYSSSTSRWQCSTSLNHSDLTRPQADSLRGVAAQRNTNSGSNQGHADSKRGIRGERVSEDSEDSDTVFSEQLTVWSQRLNERLNTAPPRRRASSNQPEERNCRSLSSRSSFTEQERGELNQEHYENADLEERRPRVWDQARCHSEEYEGSHRSRDQDKDCRLVEVREKRCSRSESVRLHDGGQHNNKDLARTWSYRDNPDKRVHFQDNSRSSIRPQQGKSRGVWEMLGQVLRERGVPVRLGGNGAPLQIGPQSRDSQVLHGSEVSCGDSLPHQRVFQRAANTRHSFHGDTRERRRSSHRENSGRDHTEDRLQNNVEHDEKVYEISRRDSHLPSRERGGSRRWKEHGYTNDDERERNTNGSRVKRTTSERRRWHQTIEERLSSEEEQEVERRVERPHRRASQRSQSLSSSSRAPTGDRSRHEAAGESLQPEPVGESLDLGELHQVLKDEELAQKLQEEEEKLLRRNTEPSPCSPYPEGDFRAAQVAQDEEIARFMQKQEMKTKRRSRELEGPSSWREHRSMISHHDRRASRDRPVQRERLDSEGLPSPPEDCSPENQPPSTFSTIPQAQPIRNIAEELDPTFRAGRPDPESLRVGQAGPTCQSLPMPHPGLHNLLEEPAFIPPTKRQTDKSGRSKPKEKKENCKQQ
ncbi:coiled-coil domain-containing protein 187 isoform X1 [Gymnodraco acuticeps]|uniref:Coiled-coil domain-containing protein 187 isoform X1 n=2 Tax=Gymnodraco acuticeps TaxID=8218 RepID=A0A6P8TRZ5_GYMAC|nr:coiled-coil domain-containing protein 187 isoform X1 [Gymnodraco acuticeps]